MAKLFTIEKNSEIFTVVIPTKAEVPFNYRPGGRWAHLTQRALELTDLRSEENRLFHRQFFQNEEFNLRVVSVEEGQEVRWAIASMHLNEKDPQPSPFVIVPQPIKVKHLFLELTRRKGGWTLERLYHGPDYIPFMPWQASVEQGLGGRELSELYWQGHAMTYQQLLNKDKKPFDQLDVIPPEWARKLR